MIPSHSQPLFDLGRLVATEAALQSIQDSGEDVSDFLNRHVHGDWTALSEIDRLNNREALTTGDRVFSVFRTGNGTKIWIITEPENELGQRFLTTVVLPSEH